MREELARADVEVDARDRDDVAVDAADAAQADSRSARRRASVSGAAGASVAKCLLQQAEPALELVVGRGQRRQEPDHVPVEAAREEEQSLLEGGRGRRLRGVGVGSRSSSASIGPRPRTSPTSGCRAAISSSRARRTVATCSARSAEAGRGELVEHGERRRARDRVAAERAAEPADVDGVHQLRAPGHRCERQAAAERLAR